MNRILVVDDDPQSLHSTARILERAQYQVFCAENGAEALDWLKKNSVDLILSDLRMPKLSGQELLHALNALQHSIPMVFMTAYGTVEEAVWALKRGAVDFLTKPIRTKVLLDTIASTLKRKKVFESSSEFYLGDSPQILALQRMIDQVAETSATVLITGESGSGKEWVARQIHLRSLRSKHAFVAVNCGAISDQLFESEFFGHEKGAFSGASEKKKGFFEAAHQGTLFLDEIGELSLNHQTKLLRVLQEKEIIPVGSHEAKAVNVRVIGATNKHLPDLVSKGLFREDLLFRIHVVSLEVPPLRDRKEDLEGLIHFLLHQLSVEHHLPYSIDETCLDSLKQYHYPGNIRELRNILERALILSGGRLEAQHFPSHIFNVQSGFLKVPLGMPLKEVEDLWIQNTLASTQGDKKLAAKILGVHERTLLRKQKEWNKHE